MLKHIGRLKNGRKVIVAYRTLPDDPLHCLIVTTSNLESADHDTLMSLVDSNVGQNAEEFADAMNRTMLEDGRNMLHRFHATGKLDRVPTEHVEMTPDSKTVIKLNELNEIIAKQKGVSIDDLAIKDPNNKKTESTTKVTESAAKTNQDPLSDEDIASSYRSQADQLFKEAKRLRDQAEQLSPTKKTKKTDEVKQ